MPCTKLNEQGVNEMKEVYLCGYYPPVIDDFEDWCNQFSMGVFSEDDWIWFEGYFTAEEARNIIKNIDKTA